jgi:hypothetical protein
MKAIKEVKRCPYCESTIDLPHPTDKDCFRAVDREMSAAIRLLRELTRRKGKLLRERIRSRQATGVRGFGRRGRPSSPLLARRLTRFK